MYLTGVGVAADEKDSASDSVGVDVEEVEVELKRGVRRSLLLEATGAEVPRRYAERSDVRQKDAIMSLRQKPVVRGIGVRGGGG